MNLNHVNVGNAVFSRKFVLQIITNVSHTTCLHVCTCRLQIVVYTVQIYIYICISAYLHDVYKVHVPVLGNPQASLVDLRIESTIRIFCEFEDCGFPNKSQKWMRTCGLNFNPHFCGFTDLRIADSPTQTRTCTCIHICMCCTCILLYEI